MSRVREVKRCAYDAWDCSAATLWTPVAKSCAARSTAVSHSSLKVGKSGTQQPERFALSSSRLWIKRYVPHRLSAERWCMMRPSETHFLSLVYET